MYRDMRHQTYFARDTFMPQADLHESCPEMQTIVNANWQFGKMPGVFSRVPKLIQEDQLLERLKEKLS